MLKAFDMFKSFSVIVLIATLALSAFADTIRLKDGSIIKGKITAFGGGVFTVVVGEGPRRREMTFTAADVESIEFDDTAAIDPRVDVQPKRVSTNNGQTIEPRVVISDNTTTRKAPETKKTEPTFEKLPPKTAEKPVPKTASVKPIEVSVKVLADNSSNGWTNSGWVVRKGQKIKISGSGKVSIGGGKMTTPEGLYDFEDATKLLKAVPTGALIAVIGDDNNDFIYIGSSREFTAARDGALFLGINEGNLSDNSGFFDVKVEIAPDGE